MNPNNVRVTAHYQLRDWSGNRDDNYEGEIDFVVVAESKGDLINDQLADMADTTIKGRASGASTGPPQDQTATQATAILNAFSWATDQNRAPRSNF